jgi:hypothetical protein
MGRQLIAVTAALAAAVMLGFAVPAWAEPCRSVGCVSTGLHDGAATLSAVNVVGPSAGIYVANNATPLTPPLYQWRLRAPCEITDPTIGGCTSRGPTCPIITDRLIGVYVIQRQRLAQPDGTPVDGVPPAASDVPGTGYGPWGSLTTGCVDVTDLNPPPSPDEVFRYFQTLPLPQLTTRQQPPGQALVGLPVIFFTDSPTTQTFTVDIRGFTVDIAATATSYTWDTGDGAVLTTTDPGAPYPDQTITHDYSSGTYTASLTTTWGATFSVDGGLAAQVPGTTTTQGPPVTFTVLQARTVLTNPYD